MGLGVTGGAQRAERVWGGACTFSVDLHSQVAGAVHPPEEPHSLLQSCVLQSGF